MRRGRRSGLYTMVAVHSTARGPSLGGCRMWSYEDSRAAVVDALRLSRAMTSKSAVAGLPLGGGKGVIVLPAGTPALDPATRRDALLDFGETVDPARRPLRDRGGRRHVRRRHDRDRRADRARGRARARARRLRRPEPLDRARRGDGDPRHLRARLGDLRPRGPQHRGDRARPRRRHARARARGRRRLARPRRRGARQARAGRGARRGLGGARRSTARGGRSRGAVRAGRHARRLPRCRCCAAARWPARRTTSWHRTRSPQRCTSAGSSGRRTSSRTRAASSTSPSSWSRRATRRSAPAPACCAIGDTIGTVFDMAESSDTTPLAAARGARAAAARGRGRLGRRRASRGLAVDRLERRRDASRRRTALTPSGSRPSSRSFSRCACSVQPAGSRSPSGTSSQAAASSSSSVRAPAASASTMRRSRSSRCAMYSSSFAAGSSTIGPWPGSRRSRSSARSRRRPSRYAASEPPPGAMKTLPSPSTASPVNAARPRRTRGGRRHGRARGAP